MSCLSCKLQQLVDWLASCVPSIFHPYSQKSIQREVIKTWIWSCHQSLKPCPAYLYHSEKKKTSFQWPLDLCVLPSPISPPCDFSSFILLQPWWHTCYSLNKPGTQPSQCLALSFPSTQTMLTYMFLELMPLNLFKSQWDVPWSWCFNSVSSLHCSGTFTTTNLLQNLSKNPVSNILHNANVYLVESQSSQAPW